MNPTTRDTIRSRAIELFSERGFSATSTREICERAGVTKPVLYYHFQNKEQLYRELILEAGKESRRALRAAARKGKTVRQRLIEALAADFALTRRNPALALLFFRMIFAPKKEMPNLDLVKSALEWLGIVEEIVAEGIRRGEMRGRAREIAEHIVGTHTIYTMGYLILGEPQLDRTRARRIIDLVYEGCGRDGR